MKYNYDFYIGLDDLDTSGNMKNKSILRMLENIACFHCDSLNVGLNDIAVTNKAWVLLEWQVEILKRPQYGQTVNASTWGRKVARLHVLRDFELYVDGELCVRATSKWASLDLIKRMPVRINIDEMIPYEIEEYSALGIDEIIKLTPLENYEKMNTYAIRKSDLDLNGHVHNTNYLDIISEFLDDNEASNIKKIHISYKKEISPSVTINIHSASIHSVSNTESTKNCYMLTSEDNTVIHALAELES